MGRKRDRNALKSTPFCHSCKDYSKIFPVEVSGIQNTRANRPLPTDDLKIIMKPEDFIDLDLLMLQLNCGVCGIA